MNDYIADMNALKPLLRAAANSMMWLHIESVAGSGNVLDIVDKKLVIEKRTAGINSRGNQTYRILTLSWQAEQLSSGVLILRDSLKIRRSVLTGHLGTRDLSEISKTSKRKKPEKFWTSVAATLEPELR